MPLPRLDLPLLCWLLGASLGAAPTARADELVDVQRLHATGQQATALQRADQFLATNPNDVPMRFMKGVLLADAQRSAEAMAQFQRLSEDHPDLAEPYNNLAALQAAAGDYAKARATLEQALRAHPDYATAHENLGDVLAALAAQSYRRALQLEPNNPTVPPKLALVRDLYKQKPTATPTPQPSDAADREVPK